MMAQEASALLVLRRGEQRTLDLCRDTRPNAANGTNRGKRYTKKSNQY